MRIEPLAVADDGALRAAYDVRAAAFEHDHPIDPPDPFEEFALVAREGMPSFDHEWWVARDDVGTTLGLLTLRLPLLDNTAQVRAELHVAPAHRRRGVGAALCARLVDRTRSLGRSHVVTEIADPLGGAGTSAGSRFAAAHGARQVLVEVFRTLDLTGLSEDELSPLRVEALEASRGYDVVAWRDRAPEEFVDDVAMLSHRMSTDVPMGDMTYEPEAWDAGRVRDKERQTIRAGRRTFTAAVRDLATGRLVAFTTVGVSPAQPAIAQQWNTLVLREHRGHRLGLLLKLANLDCVRAACPDVRVVHTWNAESNEPMIRINVRMGFVPRLLWSEWQLDLRRTALPGTH